MQIKANGLDLEVEDSGGSGTAVLLVMGLGMQLTAWPAQLVGTLVDAGLRVVRFDNRDAGLSQRFDGAPAPSLTWSFLRYQFGLDLRPPYTISDMAQDALGVLDALGIEQAHVVGASMGGMVAQRVAIARPDRVLSLTSIMSSSGARNLPGPRAKVVRAMWARPPALDRAGIIEYYVRFFKLIGSTKRLADPDDVLGAEAAAAFDRAGFHPDGTRRQLLAVAADSTRAAELAKVSCPTLVIHGRDDPFVPFVCGEDTARRIAGADLSIIDGMGHDLPRAVVAQILPLLRAHLERNTPREREQE